MREERKGDGEDACWTKARREEEGWRTEGKWRGQSENG